MAILPLARSSSSFLFVVVEGSFATNAGLAFACSAAWEKIITHQMTESFFSMLNCTLDPLVLKALWRLNVTWLNALPADRPGTPQLGRWPLARVDSWSSLRSGWAADHCGSPLPTPPSALSVFHTLSGDPRCSQIRKKYIYKKWPQVHYVFDLTLCKIKIDHTPYLRRYWLHWRTL